MDRATPIAVLSFSCDLVACMHVTRSGGHAGTQAYSGAVVASRFPWDDAPATEMSVNMSIIVYDTRTFHRP